MRAEGEKKDERQKKTEERRRKERVYVTRQTL
jgi:hypothetical protein